MRGLDMSFKNVFIVIILLLLIIGSVNNPAKMLQVKSESLL